MSSKYAVIFDNEHYTYYAGQTVTGRILVELSKPKKIRGVLFQIDGRAYVRWQESTGSGKNRSSVVYHGEEQYFKTKHYCLGGKEHPPITLDTGSYSYPFSYVLPPTLPSSFEGHYGYIRYTAKVILERPWKFNLENKALFTVISTLNLALLPNLLDPFQVNAEKYFNCWCCKKGPLTSVIRVPKTGYVPGETIPVTIEVDNISDQNIYGIILYFQQYIEFHSQSPRRKTRHEIRPLEEFTLGTLGPRNTKTITTPLLLPALPPTNANNSSIIDVCYELMLKLECGALHTNLRSKFPIIIGTVPIFEQAINNIPIITNVDPVASAPPNYDAAMSVYPGTSQDTWNGYPDLPEPTFCENKKFGAKLMQDDEDHAKSEGPNNIDGYTPRYPMYNFNPGFKPDS